MLYSSVNALLKQFYLFLFAESWSIVHNVLVRYSSDSFVIAFYY